MILDWDDTLRRGFSAIEWIGFLHERKAFSSSCFGQMTDLLHQYSKRSIGYNDFVNHYADIYFRGIQQVKEERLNEAARLFALHERGQVANFTFDLLYYLETSSYDVLILSGSPQIFLDHFFRDYSFRVMGLKKPATGDSNYSGGTDTKLKTYQQERVKYSFIGTMGDSPSDQPLIEAADIGFIVGDRIENRGKGNVRRVNHETDAVEIIHMLDDAVLATV